MADSVALPAGDGRVLLVDQDIHSDPGRVAEDTHVTAVGEPGLATGHVWHRRVTVLAILKVGLESELPGESGSLLGTPYGLTRFQDGPRSEVRFREIVGHRPAADVHRSEAHVYQAEGLVSVEGLVAVEVQGIDEYRSAHWRHDPPRLRPRRGTEALSPR
jgi:hypothetical protein